MNPYALENAELGFLHFSGGFGVAALHRPRPKKGLCVSRLEMLLPVVQGTEFLEWRAIVVGWIAALDPAARAFGKHSKTARPVKVQIGIELRGEEPLEFVGMFGTDESVANMLAHHGSVLALHQRVVGRTVGARLGELDQQFVQQPGNAMVQELAAVVGSR